MIGGSRIQERTIRDLTRLGLCLAALTLALAGSRAFAAEQVSITFTTSLTGKNYSPKNVHVVWVENSGGGFVKTMGRWANSQRSNLKTWYAKATSSDADGYTAATQSNAGTYTATWNMLPKGGSTPVADGVYTIRLELTSSNGGNPENAASFTFNKNGTAAIQNPANQGGYSNITINYTGRPVTVPDVTLTPTLLNFGTLNTGSNASLTFDISNPGGSDLIIYSLGLAGTDQGAYALIAPPATPLTIAAGTKRTITVQFSPELQQTYNNASVQVTTNVTNKATLSVTLNGAGAAPKVNVPATVLNFPSTAAGSQATQVFSIYNIGAVPLHVIALNPVGLDKKVYSVTDPSGLPMAIAGGSSAGVTVQFAPTADSVYNHAKLAIASDDPSQPVVYVALNGTGTRTATGSLSTAQTVRGRASAAAMINATTGIVGQGATLCTYDLTNPAAPTRLGAVRLNGGIYHVAVLGTVAYAALGSGGVAVVDLSNPANPQVATVLNTPGNAYDSAVTAGGTLCVADGLGGLQLFSAGTPAAPTPLAPYLAQGPVRSVATVGNTAYILDDVGGLQILDLSAPANPVKLGQYVGIDFGLALAAIDHRVYATDRGSHLYALDVTQPTTPTLSIMKTAGGVGRSIVLAGSIAYVAELEKGIEAFDISTSATASLGVTPITGAAMDLAVQGSTALVAGWSGGVRVLGLSPSSPLAELGSEPLSVNGDGVSGSGAVAAFADGVAGLRVASLGDGGVSVLRGIAAGITETHAVTISGTTAYVAAGADGLKIVDISNPAAPAVVGTFATAGFANCVAFADGSVLVADGKKVYRVDVTNPAAPVGTGTWNSDGYACGVALSGSTGYVANGGNGLRVLDLSNPASISLVGSADTGGVAYSVACSNNMHLALVAAGKAGLQIFDVTAPGSPSLLATFDTAGVAMGVAARGAKAFVADGTAGLVSVDLTTPSAPVLDAKSGAPLRAWSVSADATRMIVGDNVGGPVYFVYQNSARGWSRYE